MSAAAVTARQGGTGESGPTPSAVPDPGRRRRFRAGPWLAAAPFLILVAVGLIAPTIALAIEAFQRTDDSGVTSYTAANLTDAMQGGYRIAMLGSLRLSLLTAVVGGFAGVLIAYAIAAGRNTGLRRLVVTASGVAANFGGVPLAFAFIATIGNAGQVTTWLQRNVGSTLGINLYTFWGLTLVYLYFLTPLMIIVIFPALDGIRPQWSEAAENLGASRWDYWRLIAGPILLRPVLAGLLLLFCGAFSAYATAQAMVGSTVPLVTLQIGNVLSGNVLTGEEGIGDALALQMIVVVAIVMTVQNLVQRRNSRWLS